MTWQQVLAKHGPWVVLVFYLVGAIPFIPSPVERFLAVMNTAHADIKDSLRQSLVDHNEKTVRVLKSICNRLPANPAAPCE